MRGTEIYQLAGSVASQATSHLNNVFYEEYHKEMDKMFARLHAEQEVHVGSDDKKEYKKEYRQKVDDYMSSLSDESKKKYDRLEFSNKAEANTFAKAMQEQGFDVVMPTISVHGKYLMEVQKEIPKLDEHGNKTYDARGNLESISSSTAMYKATEKTGVEARHYSYDEDTIQRQLTDKPEEAIGNESTNFFRREMFGGEVGGVINFVEKYERLSRKYGDFNQSHAFTTDLITSQGGEKATGQWSGTNRRQEVATVLNNGVVVINGNIVEDEKMIQKVLSLHEERVAGVEKYESRYKALGAEKDSFLTQLRFSETNEKIIANTEAIRESITKQSYATGERKTGRFDGGVLDRVRDNYGLAAIALRQESGRTMSPELLTVLNKADKTINLSNVEKEFIAKMNSKMSEEGSAFVLSYDDVINTANILKRAENRDSKKNFLEDDELKLVKKLTAAEEEGGTFVLNKAELKMVGGGQVKRELDAIREDLGVDLRFREIQGHTLTALQLTHINKDFESKLASAGITYDEGKGKFVRNNGKELDKKELIKELKIVDPNLAKGFEKNIELKGYKLKDDGSFIHSRKGITEDDILKLDRAFIAKAEAQGFNFITVAGTFDIKSLEKLSDADLAKIGISKETKEALLKFHSDKWGGHNFNLTKTMVGGFTNMTVKLAAGNKWVEGDRETAEAIHTYRTIVQAPNRVKEVARYTKQAGEAARLKADAFKEKHYKNKNADLKNTVPKKPEKKVDASKRKMDKKRSEKYLTKQEERLLRKARSEKHWKPFSQLREKLDIKARASRWFANTKVGKVIYGSINAVKGFLIKIAGAFLGAYALIGGTLIILVVIMSMIQALLNLPHDLAKKFANWVGDDRPAVVVLYEYMNDDLQTAWLDDLGNYNNFYKNRDSLNYTNAYKGYLTYLNDVSIERLDDFGAVSDTGVYSLLFEDDKGLEVNPFYGIKTSDLELDENVKTNDNQPLYHKVTSYDGQNQTNILANASIYNTKQECGIHSNYSSIESGHTNNIKDIFAMVDVMYQFDIDTFGEDEKLTNILGETVASIEFENLYQTAVSKVKMAVDTVKEAGKRIVNFFLPKGKELKENEWPKWEDYWGGTVSYKTIQSYCGLLYSTSHQEQLSLDVDFYPTNNFALNIDGVTTNIINSEGSTGFNIPQETASWLKEGICTSPVQSYFKIAYNGSKGTNKIYPYIAGSGSTKYDLSLATNNHFAKFNITMNNCRDTPSSLCLWDSMGSNKETYEKISKTHSDVNACWNIKKEDKQQEVGSPAQYSGEYTTGKWFKKESDAKKDVVESFKAYVDEQMKSLSESYELASNHDSIMKTYYKKNLKYDEYTKTREVFDHCDTVNANWGSFANTNDKYYKDRLKTEVNDSNGLKPESESGNPAYKLYFGAFWQDSEGGWNNKDYFSEDDSRVRKITVDGIDIEDITDGTIGYDSEKKAYFVYVDNFDMKQKQIDENQSTIINSKAEWVTEENQAGFTYSFWRGSFDYYTWEIVNGRNWHHVVIEDDVHYWTGEGVGEDVFGSKNCLYWEFERLKTNDPQSRKEYMGVIEDGVMYRTYTDTYRRHCDGHTFEYCGGHVACHSNGIVYSVTNEQLAAAAMYPSNDMKPQALYNPDGSEYSLLSDSANDSYSPIRGKVIKQEVDYSTLPRAVVTGGAKLIYEDVQGVGDGVSEGLNLIVSGDEIGKGFEVKDDVAVNNARDIFDIDCLINKGGNVFPWKIKTKSGTVNATNEDGTPVNGYETEKAARWKQYEGWTADNMTFVAMRISNDWNSLYGFDIPLEIEGGQIIELEEGGSKQKMFSVTGVQSVTENDIKDIIEKLKDKYGSSFTEEREDAVKFALHWVGTGHYSKEHTEHDFLRETCQGRHYIKSEHGVISDIQVVGSCTAADSQGFINYYLAKYNKPLAQNIHNWQNGWGSLKPADIYKQGKFNINQIPFTKEEVENKNWLNIYLDVTGGRDTIYGIYIGTFDESFELENGQMIEAGVPVTVCLAPSPSKVGAGSVYLKSEEADGYGVTTPTQQYKWLTDNKASNKQWHSFD